MHCADLLLFFGHFFNFLFLALDVSDHSAHLLFSFLPRPGLYLFCTPKSMLL